MTAYANKHAGSHLNALPVHIWQENMVHITLQEEGSAAAAAEQLVAEETQEAAKAAAKKAKKEKAKARQQEARSQAPSTTSPSAAATAPSLQTQHDLDPMTRLHQTDSSEIGGNESTPAKDSGQQLQEQHPAVQPPVSTALHHNGFLGSREGGSFPDSDQDATGQQPRLQYRTTHEPPGLTRVSEDTALEEEVLSSATAAAEHDDGGYDMPATCAAAGHASPGADASFLDQLFCCPITKVLCPPHLEYASVRSAMHEAYV